MLEYAIVITVIAALFAAVLLILYYRRRDDKLQDAKVRHEAATVQILLKIKRLVSVDTELTEAISKDTDPDVLRVLKDQQDIVRAEIENLEASVDVPVSTPSVIVNELQLQYNSIRGDLESQLNVITRLLNEHLANIKDESERFISKELIDGYKMYNKLRDIERKFVYQHKDVISYMEDLGMKSPPCSILENCDDSLFCMSGESGCVLKTW